MYLDNVLSRKASPPGNVGLESITALGNVEASPVSNYFCKGYNGSEKYSIENIKRHRLRLKKQVNENIKT
jgi:hypothetical protein